MPGSSTTPGHPHARDSAYGHVAFRVVERVSGKFEFSRLDGWPARTPTDASPASSRKVSARLGADAGRYSFIAVDLHHLLLAGFTGAPTIRMEFDPDCRRYMRSETPC